MLAPTPCVDDDLLLLEDFESKAELADVCAENRAEVLVCGRNWTTRFASVGQYTGKISHQVAKSL